jgi:AcrR family transcriptional regulator
MDRLAILEAIAKISCARGFPSATVTQIVAAAGVSTLSFYELFESREDCFLAIFEHAVAVAAQRVIPAYDAGDGWADRLRAGLAALAAFFDEEAELARVCVIHSIHAGPATLARRSELLETLASAIDEGRHDKAVRTDLSPSIAKEVVAAIVGVIESRLHEPDMRQLTTLVNPLMFMTVLPYLGLDAAQLELFRPVDRTPSARAEADGAPPEIR